MLNRPALTVSAGPLSPAQSRVRRATGAPGEILREAIKLGRWFARNGNWQYQLTLWGVRP